MCSSMICNHPGNAPLPCFSISISKVFPIHSYEKYLKQHARRVQELRTRTNVYSNAFLLFLTLGTQRELQDVHESSSMNDQALSFDSCMNAWFAINFYCL